MTGDAAAQSAVIGVVRDSLAGRPFIGAVVQLFPSAPSSTS